ncbi:60S ribosomal protein L29 [Cricetulus griseus]|uniref:60S ribosomal protein L29 n=1 Tax=Cricetulus griseus TaxID=10029 RepID=G3H890_CRIGR|nr:60S ribosomal protein L29 [Cricetulus griseus]
MAKSKNHTTHNQSRKWHRNGIKKPRSQRWPGLGDPSPDRMFLLQVQTWPSPRTTPHTTSVSSLGSSRSLYSGKDCLGSLDHSGREDVSPSREPDAGGVFPGFEITALGARNPLKPTVLCTRSRFLKIQKDRACCDVRSVVVNLLNATTL